MKTLLVIVMSVAASACIAQSGTEEDTQSSQAGVTYQQGGGAAGLPGIGGKTQQQVFVVGQPSMGSGTTMQPLLRTSKTPTNTGDPSNGGDNTDNGDGNDPTPVPWSPVTDINTSSKNR